MHILTSPTAALANVFSASVTSMKPSERQQNFGTTTILLSKRSRQLLMLLILQIIRKPSSAATGNRPVPTIIWLLLQNTWKKNIRKFSFASIPTDLANSSIKSRSQKKWQNISMPYRSAWMRQPQSVTRKLHSLVLKMHSQICLHLPRKRRNCSHLCSSVW